MPVGNQLVSLEREKSNFMHLKKINKNGLCQTSKIHIMAPLCGRLDPLLTSKDEHVFILILRGLL